MRVLAALFLIVIFPVIVFLVTVLYGGITPASIKSSLVKSPIYASLPKMMSQSDSDDAMGAFLGTFSESYIKDKTEKLIDDVDLWVRGKSEKAPVLSFADVKANFMESNPELLEMMEAQMLEMKAMGDDGQSEQMTEFVKNDFTFPLEKQLVGLRDAYRFISVLLPVLAILAIIAIAAVLYFNHTWPGRLKWLGVTLVIAGVYGFLWAVGSGIIFEIIKSIIESQDHEIARVFVPIGVNIASEFISVFKNYQTNSSVLILVVGIVSFASSFLIKPSVKVKAVKVKSSKK